jgi:hypothetical protein
MRAEDLSEKYFLSWLWLWICIVKYSDSAIKVSTAIYIRKRIVHVYF